MQTSIERYSVINFQDLCVRHLHRVPQPVCDCSLAELSPALPEGLATRPAPQARDDDLHEPPLQLGFHCPGALRVPQPVVCDDLHQRLPDHLGLSHQAAHREQVHRGRHVGHVQPHAWHRQLPRLVRNPQISRILQNLQRPHSDHEGGRPQHVQIPHLRLLSLRGLHICGLGDTWAVSLQVQDHHVHVRVSVLPDQWGRHVRNIQLHPGDLILCLGLLKAW